MLIQNKSNCLNCVRRCDRNENKIVLLDVVKFFDGAKI